jgi:hypothetical protein
VRTDFYCHQYYNLNMKQSNKLTYLGVVLVLLGFQFLLFIAEVGNVAGLLVFAPGLVSVLPAVVGLSPVGATGSLVFAPGLVSVSAAVLLVG